MKIVCDGEEQTYEVSDLIEGKIDELLKEIYQGDPKESYTLEPGNLEEQSSYSIRNASSKPLSPLQRTSR